MIQPKTQPLLSISAISVTSALLLSPLCVFAQDVLAPPSIGQETKGEPTVIEQQVTTDLPSDEVNQQDSEQSPDLGLLGKTEINEQRRESGQVYRIELKHSSGSTQYIDQDTDGDLDNDDGIEEAPNLAKWRLGSW